MRGISLVALVALLWPTVAMAESRIDIQPVQVAAETVRYNKGRPTLDQVLPGGAIQIVPLERVRGSLSFGVTVFNDGDRPADFGLENISMQVGGRVVPVLTVDQLISKERNRAMWAQLGIAFVGALGAAAAASQQNTYRSVTYSRFGVSRSYFTGPSLAGQLQANAIAGDTGFAVASIRDQLDRTQEALGDQIIQRTTIDPGDSYGGRIILAKTSYGALPMDVLINITWNGQVYPFKLRIVKPGTAAPPAFTNEAVPVAQRAAAQMVAAPQSRTTVPGLPAGSKIIGYGIALVPAKTASGFCLRVPIDYVGTGSATRPAISDGQPRCSSN